MAPGDNGSVPVVVDLTNDSDSDHDNGATSASQAGNMASKAAVASPDHEMRYSELLRHAARSSMTTTTLPGSAPMGARRGNSMHLESEVRRTPHYSGFPSPSRRSSTVAASLDMARSAATPSWHAQAQATVGGPDEVLEGSGRSTKRMKMSELIRQMDEVIKARANSAQSAREPANKHGATTTAPIKSTQRPKHNNAFRPRLNTTNGSPSVYHVKSALKHSGSTSSLLGQFATIAARPLLLDNAAQANDAVGLPSPGLPTPESVAAMAVDLGPLDDDEIEVVEPPPPISASHMQDGDEDTVVYGMPVQQPTPREAQRRSTPPSFHNSARPSAPVPAQPPTINPPATAAERADHLLIFLKEVKRLKWADITKEFEKDIPGRTYVKLQSRYSQTLNKRDRTQDPPILSLPPRFAAEAMIDWETVHANTEGPRPPKIRREVNELEAARASRNVGNGGRRKTQHGQDDESSGTDSAPQRQRRRRAPLVNYTWPNMRTTEQGIEELMDDEDLQYGHGSNFAAPSHSESPAQRNLVDSGAKAAAHQRPLRVNSDPDDAQLSMSMRTPCDSWTERLPYLSARHRLTMSNEAEECIWNPTDVQSWQGTVLHVDFSPAELQVVERTIAKLMPSRSESRHSTYRRHLRTALKGMSPPKLHKLAYEVRRKLQSRDLQSIASFLEDAAAGVVSDSPKIHRLAIVKQSSTFSSITSPSVPSVVRQRELGLQARRGWQTSSAPISYQQKNQMMDTMGPKFTWTGASSDIHTLAWSPDGQYFAAGAVAVTDPDSMQYNRPNVLMYGDTTNGRIHELGRHSIERPRTEAGANSTHAMFVSQDPRLFTTVSSVAFSPSGKLMYSASYDKTVCIWDVQAGSQQPQLIRQLQHREPLDVLALNPAQEGSFATAARRTTHKSIKVITINEATVGDDDWSKSISNFASEKATSRPDLNMSVNALKFDPTGRFLLAGFGANMLGDSGLDTSGDICLWDVETQAALQVHGSSRNVFDVTFNPNPRNPGLFAVGCVANGNVNRGTRSVVRFYSPKEKKADASIKFTCPLELECTAYDMNDIVWCPYDANLFAAGCTDGRSYIWDLRRPDRVLYILGHGSSLMPLQDGVHHEKTDTGVRFLSWGQNARRLYSGSSDGTVKVWDVKQAQDDVFIKDLITTNSGIMSGAFTADYSKLVVGEVNGTANVLEVGRDDIALKDAERLQYQPYLYKDDNDQPASGNIDTAAAEARTWLDTGRLQLAPMNSLPRRQVVQGPNYQGPYDHAEDSNCLREQAFRFQRSMATSKGLQCDLHNCVNSINTTTYEEIGDSGRSKDRIPNSLRQQWLDETPRTVPGKSKCSNCSRPAIPSTDADTEAFCERCCFECFRCGAATSMGSSTSLFACGACGGVWDIGALGYECIMQPSQSQIPEDIPLLKRYGKEAYRERLEDLHTSFGDEMSALTDYYFGLALDRPDSPPL